MATGDQTDFLGRLVALMPTQWYPNVTPVLNGILSGAASMLATAYSNLVYTRLQTRIATATGYWLDIIAQDFYGLYISRNAGETDAAFSARIRSNLLRERGTRPDMVSAVVNLTGQVPVIFEAAQPGDTGGYGVAMGYDVAGAYGSLMLPYQSFITVYRPVGQGIPAVDGYGGSLGGYGVGALEYASLSMITGSVTDAQIDAEVARTTPAGYISWVRLLSGLSPLTPNRFILDQSQLGTGVLL